MKIYSKVELMPDSALYAKAVTDKAQQLQRELALEPFLVRLEESRRLPGDPPIFRVARIRSSPAQLSWGVLDQERAKGMPLGEAMKRWKANGTFRENFARVVPWLGLMEAIDGAVRDLNRKLLGAEVTHVVNGANIGIGIDIGHPASMSNVYIDDDMIPTLVDW